MHGGGKHWRIQRRPAIELYMHSRKTLILMKTGEKYWRMSRDEHRFTFDIIILYRSYTYIITSYVRIAIPQKLGMQKRKMHGARDSM